MLREFFYLINFKIERRNLKELTPYEEMIFKLTKKPESCLIALSQRVDRFGDFDEILRYFIDSTRYSFNLNHYDYFKVTTIEKFSAADNSYLENKDYYFALV